MAKSKQPVKTKIIPVTAIRLGWMKNRLVKAGTRFNCPENLLGAWMVRIDGKPIMRKRMTPNFNAMSEDTIRKAFQVQTDLLNKQEEQLRLYQEDATRAVDDLRKEPKKVEATFEDDPPAVEAALDVIGIATESELADAEAQAQSEGINAI